MKTKPTYIKCDRKGQPYGEPVPYTPLIVLAGTQVHKLALHKLDGEWIVAHPASGARVRDVLATYKGVPVSSGGQTLKWARAAALAQVEAMIERMGSDRFNSVLQAAADATKDTKESAEA
jgi:hypothetical protein